MAVTADLAVADEAISRHATTVGQHWLDWMAPMLPDAVWLARIDVEAAADPEISAFAVWPQSLTLPSVCLALSLRAAATQRVIHVTDAQPAMLAIPLPGPKNLAGKPVVTQVFIMAAESMAVARRQTIIRLSRWAADAPEHVLTRQSLQTRNTGLAEAVLVAATRHQSTTAIAFAIANEVGRQCACQRVSVGLARCRKVSLRAISGQPQIDNKRALPQAIVAVMESVLDQDASVEYPTTQPRPASFAELYKQNSGMPLLCISVAGHDDDTAVIVLEREGDQLFTEAQRLALESATSQALQLMLMIARQQQSGVDRFRTVFSRLFGLFGQRRLSLRTIGMSMGLAAAVLAFIVRVPLTVTAQATIEAADLQVVAAPQSGYLQSAHVRAGDLVKKGQLLATLDQRDLQVAVERWQGEAASNKEELSRALANRDRQQLGRLRADADRIRAELALVERRLERSDLRAPFAGIVLKGDPGQSLGSPVEQGEVLFEVASSGKYRLSVEVDEHDVGLVRSGQTVRVRMAAMPERLWNATLDAVQPVAVAEQGGSVFRLPATLEQSKGLRPGMQGIAKLRVGSRSIASVYTRGLRNRLRLLAWKMGLSR